MEVEDWFVLLTIVKGEIALASIGIANKLALITTELIIPKFVFKNILSPY